MKQLKITIACFLFLFTVSTKAQIREFGNFVTTGAEDAQKLFEAYITPYISGFGASMTGGWYNTAKTHKLGGFDIGLTISAAVVPQENRIFDIDQLSLGALERETGTGNVSPTVAGEREAGPDMRYKYDLFSAPAFSLPAGTGIPYVPAPMIQAGVGLVKGTEILGRFLPKIGNDKGKFGIWGIGLKHDIKQWIPGFKELPVLNVSVMGGYTKLNSHVLLEVHPDHLNLSGYYQPAVPDPEIWEGQKMVLTAGSFTSSLLVSADLPVISFYGGIGFATTNANLLLEGNYPMITDVGIDGPIVEAVADPIDIKLTNYDGKVTKPRLNAGFRIKMAVVTLNVDYTWATYNMVTVGLGVSIR